MQYTQKTSKRAKGQHIKRCIWCAFIRTVNFYRTLGHNTFMKMLYIFVAYFSRCFKPQSNVSHKSNIFLPSWCLANYPLLVVKNAPLLLKSFLRLKRQQSALCHPLNNSLLTVPVQTSSTRVKDSIKRMRTRKRDGSTKGSNLATC